jgi:hypothetical protein
VGFWSQWEERDTQRGPLSPAKPLPHLEYWVGIWFMLTCEEITWGQSEKYLKGWEQKIPSFHTGLRIVPIFTSQSAKPHSSWAIRECSRELTGKLNLD